MYNDFAQIPQFTRDANYRVNVAWDHIAGHIERYQERGCDLDPDFQREHVWSEQQQIAFVEFKIRGGKSGSEILFNHPNWMGSFKGMMVLVDGKQRLNAVMRFMRNEIPAFGTLLKDFKNAQKLRSVDFVICVNTLKTRAEVLQWYLDINTGGTPHTNDEIEKVRHLLIEEKNE